MRSPSGRRWPVVEPDAGESRDGIRRVVKDMGITHADFFRSVRPLLEGADHTLRDDRVTLRLDAGTVEIRLGPEGRRSLGNFHLPRTRVELRFRDCAPDTIDTFIARFDTRFRRGGG
jgi:hypothetical protein